jgi:von Willebrand factor type A domain
MPLQSGMITLQEHLQLLEAERQQLLGRRRWHLLMVGASLSMLVHICLLLYLGMVYRGGHAGTGTGEVTYEFAIEDPQGLTELDNADLNDLVPEVGGVDEAQVTDATAELNPAVPSMDRISAANLVPSLAASGGASATAGGGAGTGNGEGMGLGGGGGGTSFFGVAAKGTRFAYIVDVSGSMEMDRKIQTAMRETARSIESLPDYAQFYVVLFSSIITQPPGQKGWTRARKPTVRNLIRWLNSIEPGGGTTPKPAFAQVFALDVRPDVIFFLTDGEVVDFTAEQCAAMNSSGRRAIINTIAFGDPSSQDLLKRIAADSGGVYRFVPTTGKSP